TSLCKVVGRTMTGNNIISARISHGAAGEFQENMFEQALGSEGHADRIAGRIVSRSKKFGGGGFGAQHTIKHAIDEALKLGTRPGANALGHHIYSSLRDQIAASLAAALSSAFRHSSMANLCDRIVKCGDAVS